MSAYSLSVATGVEMTSIYIGVGSSIEPEHHIRLAITELRRCYGELTLSTVYESQAIGFVGDNFYNLVVGCESAEPLPALIAMLRQIEDQLERDRTAPRFSARTIDLDLLLYGDAVVEVQGLQLPRAEITENAFVLQPLAEIAAEQIHPLLQQSYAQLWAQFDKQKQQLWPINFTC